MDCIAGKEHPAFAISVSEQQVLLPHAGVDHLVKGGMAMVFSNIGVISASVATIECKVKCRVESCTIISCVARSSATW